MSFKAFNDGNAAKKTRAFPHLCRWVYQNTYILAALDSKSMHLSFKSSSITPYLAPEYDDPCPSRADLTTENTTETMLW